MSDRSRERVTRRKFIVGASIGMAAIAGCSSSDGDTETTPTPTPTPTTTEEPTAEFEIQEIVVDETYETGDSIEPQVTVENVGDKSGTVILEFSVGDQNELVEKTIDSGSISTASTTFATSDFGAGVYDVSVESDESSVSATIDLFQVPDSGFYGRLKAPGDISLENQYIDLGGNQGESRDRSHSGLDEDGFFTISHLFEPPYQARLSFTDQDIGDFNGLPPVVEIYDQTVNSAQKSIGTVELPRAYRTEVRLVDSNGDPVTDIDRVSIRDTSSGYGVYHERFTLTADGYLKVDGASDTGVPAPEESTELNYQIELVPKAEDEWQTLLGEIYGSEAGEEFEFTVDDPSLYK